MGTLINLAIAAAIVYAVWYYRDPIKKFFGIGE